MRTHEVTQWRFALADDPGADRKDADDTAWRTVTVPHDWSVEHDFSRDCSSGTGYLPGGIGWYRAHVSVRELAVAADERLRLVFHGVYKNADVWVNGYHLGGRPSGHAHFSFDLTEILGYAPDDDLVIAVRVEHTELSDSRWYNGAGINRRVELQVLAPVHLREHGTSFTTLEASSARATVRIQQEIEGEPAPERVVCVRHELRPLDSDDTLVHDSQVALVNGAADVDTVLEVPSPRLWSDTEPHLYRLTTTLAWSDGDGEQRASATDVVGIRVVEFDADHGLRVNGERRLLRGVCLHEDAGCLGTAVPAAVWLRRLLSLRSMGCNAVRMAHNPHAPELYTLCDVLGLFVIDEAFDEWENPKNKWWQGHNVYPPRHQGPARHFPQWHERDLAAMVRAHRLHPSVIAWSIGNEIDYPNDPYASPLFAEMTGNNDARKPEAERRYDPSRPDVRRLTRIARRLAGIVRAHDPSRPVTLAAAFPELSSRTGLLETVDVVGYNYKEHLYDADHARFPAIPFLGSENSHRYDAWRAVLDADHVAGQFLWTGVDYLGEAAGWPVRGSGAGLLTLAGFEKPLWHLRRSWWGADAVAHLVVRPRPADGEPGDLWSHPASRHWDPSSPGDLEVLCFTDGDVTLIGDGEELPVRRDDRLGCWSAVVPARTARLELESRRDGRLAARDELTAGGPAARLDAAVWRVPDDVRDRCRAVGLELDGLAQVECRLLDAEGRPARGEVVVTARVDDGTLRGLENGDLADLTPYRSSARSTLDGRLVVFVGCDDRTVVELAADGLPGVRVRCEPSARRSVGTPADLEIAAT